MKVREIAFVAYPVTDIKRARQFYEQVLGLTASTVFGGEHRSWVEYDIGPGTLAISNFDPSWKPSGGGMAGLEVDDINVALAEVKASGMGKVNPAHETPVCHMAFIEDPDGNSIILHKRKADA